MKTFGILPGKPMPLGATPTGSVVNFSIFTRNGKNVILDIYEDEDDDTPCFSYEFDPEINRTGDLWHVALKGLPENALYLYRVGGEFNPEKGFRFNQNESLIDPYAKALTNHSIFLQKRKEGIPSGLSVEELDENIKPGMPKCVVIDDEFDWQGDRPLNYPLRFSVLYETHVKGFTASKDSNVRHPGTYKGIIEKIPYLKTLGITSLELLPIHEFDENENIQVNPKNGKRLKNYWGYSTINFFSPKASYSSSKEKGAAVREFKEMVRELHKAGIEVILDVVFNHTAEGNEKGLTLSFRGLDNSIYYMLEENNKAYYKNYSGCGNTFNCNHPIVRSLIIDCLRYWVTEMHIDGFRFDLGSILGRDQSGRLMENPPMLERIAEDPVLRNTKIIAEAWDAGGAYQVGWFPGGRWAEWNDRYRDDMRKFWRGDGFMARHFATRLTGSSDLYLRDGRKPFHSINFLTSHDGFTLNDLVSYNGKHNEENGEHNRDGNNNNNSFNYGFEGPTVNSAIEKIRVQQIKNFILTLLISQGAPMLLGGDEIRRTQNGNNNAYCQDNEISWYKWSDLEKNKDIFEFTRKVIKFRLSHPAFMRPEFFSGRDGQYNAIPDITWFNEQGLPPDWSRGENYIALRLDGSKADVIADRDDNDFFIMFNASPCDITFHVCSAPRNKKWYRAVDTSYPSPVDILESGKEEYLKNQNVYVVPSKSVAVLLSK